MDLKCVNVQITGRVQGVGYRYFVQEKAVELGLTGWVRNLPNGNVEAMAQGSKEKLSAWLSELEHGPLLAKVSRVQTDWCDVDPSFQTFAIR